MSDAKIKWPIHVAKYNPCAIEDAIGTRLLAHCQAVHEDSPGETEELVAAANAGHEAEATIAALRKDYDEACKLVADMHAAAVGCIRGPISGVVEDIVDLRRELFAEIEQNTAKRNSYREEAVRIRDEIERLRAELSHESKRVLRLEAERGPQPADTLAECQALLAQLEALDPNEHRVVIWYDQIAVCDGCLKKVAVNTSVVEYLRNLLDALRAEIAKRKPPTPTIAADLAMLRTAEISRVSAPDYVAAVNRIEAALQPKELTLQLESAVEKFREAAQQFPGLQPALQAIEAALAAKETL